MDHRRLLLLLLFLFLILFLASTTTQAAGGHGQAQQQGKTGPGVGSIMRSMVGSRPPSCAGRCWWCGGRRCEAVQVPVTPQQEMIKKGGGGSSIPPAAAAGGGGGGRRASHAHALSSSYDDRSSNYKPLSWRCMCGEVNP